MTRSRIAAGKRPARILMVLHQENSSPARIGYLLQKMGYALDMRKPRFGDALPATMDDYAGAVVFGGPMSANDQDEYIRREIDWLGVPLRENKPVLGICLGAQMMARHLGVRVYAPDDGAAEIGYYPIKATASGNTICPEKFPSWVYQWHREGFDLPRGATLLAEGRDLFPVQAFRCGSATALQFHPEVTYAMMWRWTTRGHDRMKAPGARERQEHMDGWFRHDPPVARWLGAFLERWAKGETAGSAAGQSAMTSAQ